MPQVIDVAAIIEALGTPPRTFPEAATTNLPRTAGKVGAAVGSIVFGGLLLVMAFMQANDRTALSSEREKIPVVVGAGLFLVGLGGWLLRMRARIRSTCVDVLSGGRATVGKVESLDVRQIQGNVIDTYRIGYTDASGGRHVLKAFWKSPWMRVGEGGEVVILHDTEDPRRAAVVPLDYPDLRLSATRDPALEMMSTLERLGVPLDFGISTPKAALVGGVVKAGLYQGVKKIEAGQFDEAIASLDSVLKTAGDDPAFAAVRAVACAQRGLAHEKGGDPRRARLDYEAALGLNPSLQEARDGLARLGAV